MPDDVTALFEEELRRRGVSFSSDDEPGRYKVQHGGSKLFISLSNLTRKYRRDPDNTHVANFADTVLGAQFDALPWEQARASVLFCLEPTDYGRVEQRRGDSGFVSKPGLRFLFPLIERNVRISRITLSGWLHVRPTAYMIGASVRDG